MKLDRLSPIASRFRTEYIRSTQNKIMSGGTAFVTMVKPANFGQFHYNTAFGRLDLS